MCGRNTNYLGPLTAPYEKIAHSRMVAISHGISLAVTVEVLVLAEPWIGQNPGFRISYNETRVWKLYQFSLP